MITMLAAPLLGETLDDSMPVLLIGLTRDLEGELYAIGVGSEGEPVHVPWDETRLRIAWRFDHEKDVWLDVGPSVTVEAAAEEGTDT